MILLLRAALVLLLLNKSSSLALRNLTTQQHYMSNNINNEHYRADGVCMGFDPHAPGMAEKYGLEGQTDKDGFDPYSDSVGAGIYGGNVQRNKDDGSVVIGQQYQNHNDKPGPVYDGTGYSLMSRAIHKGPGTVKQVLMDFPQLVNEVTTGGARPLHICGMSQRGQYSTQTLIDAGADLHVLDTYNYNALHRMASNNLDVGATALVNAGMDPNFKPDESDATPIEIAQRSRAIKFLMAMQKLGHYD